MTNFHFCSEISKGFIDKRNVLNFDIDKYYDQIISMRSDGLDGGKKAHLDAAIKEKKRLKQQLLPFE